jgi:PAS domain S-box-containing protein
MNSIVPHINKAKFISNDAEILRWNGIAVVVQAVLTIFMFLFLPEFYDPVKRDLMGWLFVLMVFFGLVYYFTPLIENRALHYLPYFALPIFILFAMFVLPSVSYYYLFLFFVFTISYALNWAGNEIIYYLMFASIALIIFSFRFTNLPFLPALMLAFALVVSLLLFGFIHVLYAQTIYRQREEKNDVEKLSKRLAVVLRRYRTIMNTIGDGIVVIDDQEKIQSLNQGVVNLLGWQPLEVRGRKLEEILGYKMEFFDGDEKKTMFFGDLLLRPAKQPGVRLKNKEGKFVFADLTVSPLTLGSKDKRLKRGFMLTIHDVTHETELQKMKLDFVAMAAHELRTPLTSIKGYLTTVIDEIGQTLAPEYQKFLDRALNSTKSLQVLMENLLSITKIEKGSRPLSKMPLNWEDTITRQIEDYRPLARDRGLSLAWVAPGKRIPEVMADPLVITEVLNNLVANALNYTEKGGVTISAEHDEKTNTVITHVTDTGQGIPKDKMHHLFERFYRVTGILEKGRAKGTGLGLYITKTIVEQHGGKIWVDSEEGMGTTFSFSLDVVKPVEPTKTTS